MENLNVDPNIFVGKKILIGTPTYENGVKLQYTTSVNEVLVFATKNNIKVDIKFGTQDSLIPRVRNDIVNYFL